VKPPKVVIIRTGSANLASVLAAMERLGVDAQLTESPKDVLDAPFVVLPGVGAFGAAMGFLRERDLDVSVRDRVLQGRPLLAICLGMQLLTEWSEESPGVRGLGMIPGCVRRFPSVVRVPQVGWNQVEPCGVPSTVIRPAWMYFSNSYRLARLPDGWIGAMAEHGSAFIAAVERGPLLACQFHPELSGNAGLDLIDRWLTSAGSRECAATDAAVYQSWCRQQRRRCPRVVGVELVQR